MNCEQCQELISAFLDNDLGERESANVLTHLGLCVQCAKICEDFAVILDFCHEQSTPETLLPNSQALWCRISNTIETEIKTETVQENKQKQTETKSGWMPRVWKFSFAQVASAVLGIALLSSLLTVVGVKNYSAATDGNVIVTSPAEPNAFEKVLGKLGLIETTHEVRQRRIEQQRAAIEYWNKRVEARRMQWDAHLREAFDRNLNEIDQAVNEYTLILQENPQDELSGEMLDSTLNEKMELLREFSDL
ncbi:MAG TPA: zf-HC2 domain-containing protein [Pyrinomonadaceae bacterium]|jgi:hypothetical protein